jgi:hypothetical protein
VGDSLRQSAETRSSGNIQKCSTHGGVNEQPFKLGALMARVTETVKERTFHLQRMQECYRK